jgi:uncharacterized protein with FMN-binding domain
MPLLSSNVQVNAITKRKSKGVLQAVALLGLSVTAAYILQNHQVSTPTTSSSATSTNSTPKTATGDAINYQFGTIQLSVTKANGAVTAVDLVQATASAGRDQAFSYLVTDAIKANGSNFANLSGATYTTAAFKAALDSAISKLG